LLLQQTVCRYLVPERETEDKMQNLLETNVLIVGGGPAGTSAALSLLKYSDLKVVIVEETGLESVKIGEQVNSSIFDLLSIWELIKQLWIRIILSRDTAVPQLGEAKD
jgi:alkyl hydroperoxide reductase subunit AhpF